MVYGKTYTNGFPFNGETHSFRTSCKRLSHPFERVHRTAERVMKYSELLTRTGERLTHPFEQVDIKTGERVRTTHDERWCHIIIPKEWTNLVLFRLCWKLSWCINKSLFFFKQLSFDKKDFALLLLRQKSNLKESCHLFISAVSCVIMA